MKKTFSPAGLVNCFPAGGVQPGGDRASDVLTRANIRALANVFRFSLAPVFPVEWPGSSSERAGSPDDREMVVNFRSENLNRPSGSLTSFPKRVYQKG